MKRQKVERAVMLDLAHKDGTGFGHLKRAGIAAAILSIAGCTLAEGNRFEIALAGNAVPIIERDLPAARTGAGHYLSALHAENIGDGNSAATFISRVLATDPGTPTVLRRAHLILLREGRFTEAARLASRIREQQITDIFAPLTLSVVAMEAGNGVVAAAEIERINSTGALARFLPLFRGWALVGQKPEDALAAVSDIGNRNEMGAIRALHLALLNDFLGRSGEAEKHYKATLEIAGPGSFRAAEDYGEFLERQNRQTEALAVYARFHEENPDSVLLELAIERAKKRGAVTRSIASPRAGFAAAMFDVAASFRQDSGDAALVFVQLGLALQPKDGLALVQLGDLLELRRRPADAIQTYRRIEESLPASWPARLRIAASHYALKQTDEATQLLTKMSAEHPTRFDVMQQLGNIFRGVERFAEAAKAYDEAIKRVGALDRRHWQLLYSRGIAFERSGAWERAEADFLRALSFEAEQPYVLNYLGYSWVDRGINLDRAREMIERAVKLRPNDGHIVDSLGWALFRMGDFQGAVTHLERAVELQPNESVINDHLGDAYWLVGRRIEARFQWQRALTQNPEPKLVQEIQDKLARGLVAQPAAAQAK
jgi:tetratricopeptide (TPR) repeat protein